MARSRRRAPMRTTRRAPRDWVYRSNAALLGVGTNANDQLGTYQELVMGHSTGVAQAQSHILYDSHDYMAELTRGGVGTGNTINAQGVLRREARAEGRKPCIHAVEGVIYVEPTVWAIGNLIALGARLGVFEQDTSGVFLLDASYSMWTDQVLVLAEHVSKFANNRRNNAWERRWFMGWSDTRPFMVVKIRWRGRRYLESNECFGLFTELQSTSVNTRMQYWMRTLVSGDDG